MLFRSVPHAGETPIAIAFQHVHSDIPAPSLVNPELPAVFDRLIRRATQRNPDLRYQSAEEFLTEIRHARGVLEGTHSDRPDPVSVQTLPTTIIEKPDQLPSTAVPAAVDEVINRDTKITERELPEVRRERVTGRRRNEAQNRRFGRSSRKTQDLHSRTPKRRRGRLVVFAIIPLLVLSWFGYQQSRTEVPDLIGITKIEASSP